MSRPIGWQAAQLVAHLGEELGVVADVVGVVDRDTGRGLEVLQGVLRLLARRVDVGRPVGDDQLLSAAGHVGRPALRRVLDLATATPNSGSTATLPIPNAATPAPLRKVRLLGPEPAVPVLPTTRTPPVPVLVSESPCHRTPAMRQGIPLLRHANATEPIRESALRNGFLRLSDPDACHAPAATTTMSAMADKSVAASEHPRPRRGVQVDHRAAPAGRPSLLRLDRQGGRALRGRRAPAGAAADRGRRDADRRGHRPARSSASAARRWSASTSTAACSRSPTRWPRWTR